MPRGFGWQMALETPPTTKPAGPGGTACRNAIVAVPLDRTDCSQRGAFQPAMTPTRSLNKQFRVWRCHSWTYPARGPVSRPGYCRPGLCCRSNAVRSPTLDLLLTKHGQWRNPVLHRRDPAQPETQGRLDLTATSPPFLLNGLSGGEAPILPAACHSQRCHSKKGKTGVNLWSTPGGLSGPDRVAQS